MSEISIAIPTYEMNGAGASYLEELFVSIQKQEFEDFEVCVSDHSEDDEILDVCGQYANFFTIQYFRNKDKRGNGPANTNSAVEMCEGRVTKLLFQDDLFIDPYALSRINEVFQMGYDWAFNGFAHTTDGKVHHRMMVPRWTDMMLEGRNLLGSPSCVSFLTEKFEGFDEDLVLLMDTDFYHRMRYNHGRPKIIEEILTSNREHQNRISSSSVQYDKRIEHPEGPWLVNSNELDYVLKKNESTRVYPDEVRNEKRFV